jgi:hypothetical protein
MPLRSMAPILCLLVVAAAAGCRRETAPQPLPPAAPTGAEAPRIVPTAPASDGDSLPAASPPVTVVHVDGEARTISAAQGVWISERKLIVYALSDCPELQCERHFPEGRIHSGALTRDCPDYRVFGAIFEAAEGERLRPGRWPHGTADAPVDARPLVARKGQRVAFEKGTAESAIELLELTADRVRYRAAFEDVRGRRYAGEVEAPLCPSSLSLSQDPGEATAPAGPSPAR